MILIYKFTNSPLPIEFCREVFKLFEKSKQLNLFISSNLPIFDYIQCQLFGCKISKFSIIISPIFHPFAPIAKSAPFVGVGCPLESILLNYKNPIIKTL